MLCPTCNVDNPDAARFCGGCGKALTNQCGKCGTHNPPKFNFCCECGTALRSAPDSSTSTAVAENASLRGLVAESDRVTSNDVLGGERKIVTALFADIKGSTELMRELDPEEARALLDPVLNKMMAAVQRYDGYVVQSTGDGIFGMFGAPVAHEDHAQRALHVALAIQQELREHAKALMSRGEHGLKPVPLEVRIGINTGEVVLRMVNTGGHTEYSPVGLVVNLASRLQTVAAPGGIVIGEDTKRLVEGYFELRAFGPAMIKGVAHPLKIYEVVGAGTLRGHFDLAARRGLTKFVGRERELDHMKHALQLVQTGHGQIVALVAEPGAGKSRLIYEFKDVLPAECKLLEAYSVSHGKASAWLPVLELLRSYFGIQTADDAATRREKVRVALAMLDPALDDTLPYLLGLLGIQESLDPLEQMDAQIKRQRTLDAIKRILIRESQNQPTVVIFEDLHWIDAETQALLNLLADSIANSLVLLLVNYRPEYRHEWTNKSYYTQLRLDALTPDSAGEMLSALVGEGVELTLLKRLVIERGEGNPFFIEEMVESLFEEGVLVRDVTVKMTRPLAQLRLPPTVQGMLAARIDRLPAQQKDLLQTLAVLGRNSALELTRQVVSIQGKHLDRMLADLQAGEFIYEKPAADQVEYTFKHALTQEVAYNSLLVERRKLLHERAGQAMESLYSNHLDDHIDDLAHHYSHSDNVSKAVEYLTRAGQRAMRRSAHLEAIVFLTSGLDFLMKLPETPERDRQEIALQAALGPSLMETKGDSAAEVETVYRQIAELGERTGETLHVFGALGGLFLNRMVRGQYDAAHRIANHLVNLAQASDDPDQLLIAHTFMGIILFWIGELSCAHTYFEQAATHIDPPRQRHLAELYGMDVATGCSGYAACPLWMMGYPGQALQRIQRGLSLARERNHLSSSALALYWASFGHLLRRESQTAQEFADAALALANEHGFAMWAALCTIVLGRALLQSGREVEAIAHLEEGIKASRARGAADLSFGALAEAYGRTGRAKAGLRLIEEELAKTADIGRLATEPELHRIKGELLLLQDLSNPEEAERCFRTAIEKAQRIAAKSGELRAAMSLARLLARQARRDEARTMLAEIYGWFIEGFDTADLKDAKALLEELNARGR